MMHNNNYYLRLLLVCIVGLLCVSVNAGINVCILKIHVNVVMGSQLDEHLLFWQPTISIILYVIALYIPCLFF